MSRKGQGKKKNNVGVFDESCRIINSLLKRIIMKWTARIVMTDRDSHDIMTDDH